MILEAPKGIETSTDEELKFLKQEVENDKEKKEFKFFQEGYNAAKSALEEGGKLAKQIAEQKLKFPDSKAKVEEWAEKTVKTLPYMYLLQKNAELYKKVNKWKQKRGDTGSVREDIIGAVSKVEELGGHYLRDGNHDQMRVLGGNEESWEFGSKRDTIRGILNYTAYKTKEGVDREDPKKLEEIFNSRPHISSDTALLDTGRYISEGEYMNELGTFMVLVEKLNEYGN